MQWLLAGVLVAAVMLTAQPVSAGAQQSGSAQTATPPPATPQTDQTTPDAGGPASDSGVIAIPKKKAPDEPPPAPITPPQRDVPRMHDYTLTVNVPIVTVDASVLLEKNRQFVPGLKASSFRVSEDGVVQKIEKVEVRQTPITAAMLLEFASTNYNFVYDMRNAAYQFFRMLRPDDYIAVVTYDMRTSILADFTQDKTVVAQALQSLTIPGFSETNLFDALYETLDRMSRIPGQKYIILIASGRDTFSKLTLDKITAKVKATRNVTIFTISTGGLARELGGGRGGMRGQMANIEYLQADNQMITFAQLTGGLHFAPVFEGELPDDFKAISQSIRNEYVITYKPTNAKLDGTYRRLKVELVDDEGKPLHMQDEKNKQVKYVIIARDGYKASQEVQ
jgi:VWFA-related protein